MGVQAGEVMEAVWRADRDVCVRGVVEAVNAGRSESLACATVMNVVLIGGGLVLGTRSLWRLIGAARMLGLRVQSLALKLPGELAQAAT